MDRFWKTQDSERKTLPQKHDWWLANEARADGSPRGMRAASCGAAEKRLIHAPAAVLSEPSLRLWRVKAGALTREMGLNSDSSQTPSRMIQEQPRRNWSGKLKENFGLTVLKRLPNASVCQTVKLPSSGMHAKRKQMEPQVREEGLTLN